MIDVETIARKWANVYELALPADLEGGYDAANNRILISDRLTLDITMLRGKIKSRRIDGISRDI